jgi:hypothetical protein
MTIVGRRSRAGGRGEISRMDSGKRTTTGRGQRRAALVATAADLFKDKRGLYLAVLERTLKEIVDLHRPRSEERL